MRRHAAVLLLLGVLVALAGCTAPVDVGLSSPDAPADPLEDQLGWEQGYWHNESLPVTTDDGLNQTELNAIVGRSMARVEYIRHLEFEKPVPVDVISRQKYRQQYAGSGNASKALRAFDNAKFESLFLVGEQSDSLNQQSQNRGTSVLGFYSPSADRIVIISETETPAIEETTLGHELVHAAQFRTFQMNYERPTRDKANAVSGLIEGDASYVDQIYRERCGEEWSCVSPPARNAESGGNQSGGSTLHLGIYIMRYFPYSDGPGFVKHFRAKGGWDRVNRLYEDPADSAEQVAVPSKYGTDPPVNVSLADRSSAAWKRVTPPGRAPYGEVGVAGITAMIAWPSYHQEKQGGVVSPRTFLNFQPDGQVNRSDPFDYTNPYAGGWEGDKLYVYQHRESGELGYVWKLAWESPGDAQEFAEVYRALLRYWGGQPVSGAEGVWRIPSGEFADAFYLHVEGDTVVVVNAPTTDQLDDVRSGTPTA